jgi:hypothetical protein
VITSLVPSIPLANAATNTACNAFTANWNSDSNAAGYRLDVSSDNFVTFTGIYNDMDVGNVSSYNVTGLISGTTYKYRIRAYGNCAGSSSTFHSNEITVAMGTQPATPVVNVINNCGYSVLSVNATGTLVWSPGGQTTSQITVTIPGTYTVIETIGTCSSNPGSGVAAPISIPVTPVVNVVNNCGYSVMSTSATGSLIWNPGGQSTAQVIATIPGTYSVIQTVSGCSSTAGYGVAAPMTIPIIILGRDSTICANQSILLNAGYPGSIYLWMPHGQTSQTIIADSGGLGLGTHSFSVQVNYNGCTGIDTINITFVSCFGMDEISKETVINLFPNPSDGNFILNAKGLSGVICISIYNVEGQLIWSRVKELSQDNRLAINVSDFAKGLYFLKLSVDDMQFYHKLLIE